MDTAFPNLEADRCPSGGDSAIRGNPNTAIWQYDVIRPVSVVPVSTLASTSRPSSSRFLTSRASNSEDDLEAAEVLTRMRRSRS